MENVVKTYEINGYDDSNFMAVVYNGKTFVSVLIGSTRFGGGVYDHEINANDEIKAKYEKFCAERKIKYERMARLAELSRSYIGNQVVVLKGRKIPKGTQAVVERVRPDFYTRGFVLKVCGQWIKANNVGVIGEIDGESVIATDEDHENFMNLPKNYVFSE